MKSSTILFLNGEKTRVRVLAFKGPLFVHKRTSLIYGTKKTYQNYVISQKHVGYNFMDDGISSLKTAVSLMRFIASQFDFTKLKKPEDVNLIPKKTRQLIRKEIKKAQKEG